MSLVIDLRSPSTSSVIEFEPGDQTVMLTGERKETPVLTVTPSPSPPPPPTIVDLRRREKPVSSGTVTLAVGGAPPEIVLVPKRVIRPRPRARSRRQARRATARAATRSGGGDPPGPRPGPGDIPAGRQLAAGVSP